MMLPVVYLQQVPEPQLAGKTNADLLNWALELQVALRLANADKQALINFFNELKKMN